MPEFGLGVWSHRITDFEDEESVLAHAQTLAAQGFNLVIPCVKNPPGAVDFLTNLADINPGYPDWDPLRVLIEGCRERGIKVHPWFCIFPEGDMSRLLRMHPEYEAQFEAKLRWACACRPEVQRYVLALYEDLAGKYKPHGLHLDYIRTGGLCRCGYCRDGMVKRGVDIASVEARDPSFEIWTDWRVSRITDFVGRLRTIARAKGVEVSAAVFANYPDSIAGQGQDWVHWAELGLVDYLFPMNYTNSLRVARTRTIEHVALVGGRIPVWEGLGKKSSASELSTKALQTQARTVVEAGASGVVIFQHPSVTEADVEALRSLRH